MIVTIESKTSGPVASGILIEAMTRQLATQLETASVISHPGEVGRARENLVRDYIRDLVPGGFGSDTGFVIDCRGNVSTQQDIIIYRLDYHPTFSIGGVRLFTVEGVAAVVEVKSRLDTASLQDALAKLESVKDLDRSAGGRNYVVAGGIGGQHGTAVNLESHEHQVFTAIVGADSVTVDTAIEVLQGYLSEHERKQWPNTIATVTRGWSIQYCNTTNRPPSDTMAATQLQVNDGAERTGIIDLVGQLWSFLRVAPVVDVQPSQYMPPSGAQRRLLPLDPPR
jgi:hypothetical protein